MILGSSLQSSKLFHLIIANCFALMFNESLFSPISPIAVSAVIHSEVSNEHKLRKAHALQISKDISADGVAVPLEKNEEDVPLGPMARYWKSLIEKSTTASKQKMRKLNILTPDEERDVTNRLEIDNVVNNNAQPMPEYDVREVDNSNVGGDLSTAVNKLNREMDKDEEVLYAGKLNETEIANKVAEVDAGIKDVKDEESNIKNSKLGDMTVIALVAGVVFMFSFLFLCAVANQNQSGKNTIDHDIDGKSVGFKVPNQTPPLFCPATVIVMFGSFSVAVLDFMQVPLFPLLHESQIRISVLFSAKPLTQIFFNLILMNLFVDKISNKTLMLFGMVFGILCNTVFLLTMSWNCWFLARVLSGISSTLFNVSGMAELHETYAADPDKRGQALNLSVGAIAFAICVGPFYGGSLHDIDARLPDGFLIALKSSILVSLGYMMFFGGEVDKGANLTESAVKTGKNSNATDSIQQRKEEVVKKNSNETGKIGEEQTSRGKTNDNAVSEDANNDLVLTTSSSSKNATTLIPLSTMLAKSEVLFPLLALFVIMFSASWLEALVGLFLKDKLQYTPTDTGVFFLLFGIPCFLFAIFGRGLLLSLVCSHFDVEKIDDFRKAPGGEVVRIGSKNINVDNSNYSKNAQKESRSLPSSYDIL